MPSNASISSLLLRFFRTMFDYECDFFYDRRPMIFDSLNSKFYSILIWLEHTQKSNINKIYNHLTQAFFWLFFIWCCSMEISHKLNVTLMARKPSIWAKSISKNKFGNKKIKQKKFTKHCIYCSNTQPTGLTLEARHLCVCAGEPMN